MVVVESETVADASIQWVRSLVQTMAEVWQHGLDQRGNPRCSGRNSVREIDLSNESV